MGAWPRRLMLRAERGAVATIVAALFGGGAALGFAALSMDVGSLMWERRQLQAGADASALALAQSCALDAAKCSGSNAETAGILTDLNNRNNYKDSAGGFDGSVYPQGICGTNLPAGASLPNCASPSSGLSDCPAVAPSLPANVPYVEAHTITKQSNGSTILPTWLARTLVGGSTGTAVKACARAAWGTPSSGPVKVPITISGCDWMHATGGTPGGGGGSYYPAPKYVSGGNPNGYGNIAAGQPAWPSAPATPPAQNQGGEVILLVQNPPGGQTAPNPCPAPPASGAWQGHALPGGFGLLEAVSGNPCDIKQYPYHWMNTDPGASTGCDLSAWVGKVVNLPVFDCTASSVPASEPPIGTCTAGAGSNAAYHRAGYAAFYLSGYSMTVTGGLPNKVKSVNPNFNQFPCTGGASCISGWFITGSLNATAISGPPSGSTNFGTFTVLPAG